MSFNFVIGDFIPSKVVNVNYSQKEVTLTCASFKKKDGSDPMEEIEEIQKKVAHGYDNSSVLQAGTVLQSFNPDDIIVISDGFESFIGLVADVVVPTDQFRNDLIIYQIKLAHYLAPKEPVESVNLVDGDETVWDDDWEAGYEKYSSSDCTVSSDNEVLSYIAGSNYDTVWTYNRKNRIEGQPYKEGYGYLEVPLNLHKIPYNLVGYTTVIDFGVGQEHDSILFNVGYGGQGKQVIGKYGEVTYQSATTMPKAKFFVNEVEYDVPWIAGPSIDDIIIQSVVVNQPIVRYLKLRVETSFNIFILQKVAPLDVEVEETSQCNKSTNQVSTVSIGGPLYGKPPDVQNVSVLKPKSSSGGLS